MVMSIGIIFWNVSLSSLAEIFDVSVGFDKERSTVKYSQ